MILLGVGIVFLSPKIVFPCLETLLGIETIVGRENVMYEPDGTYIFTNPSAMVQWIVSVAVIRVAFACSGGWVLIRTSGSKGTHV